MEQCLMVEIILVPTVAKLAPNANDNCNSHASNGFLLTDTINKGHQLHGLVHRAVHARNCQFVNDKILADYLCMKGMMTIDITQVRLELQKLVVTLTYLWVKPDCNVYFRMKSLNIVVSAHDSYYEYLYLIRGSI